MLGAITWAAEGDVKRGEYLARAGDCISCHSNGADAPFTGGLLMNYVRTSWGNASAPGISAQMIRNWRVEHR